MQRAPGHYRELPVFYQAKRDYFRAAVARSRFRLLDVQGAYFQLAEYDDITDEDDQAFCIRLVKEHGVAAIPTSVFYESPPAGQRIIRFCFAKTEATLTAAAERLCAI